MDPEKENYMNRYKKSIFRLAMAKRMNKKSMSEPSYLEVQKSSSLMYSESKISSKVFKEEESKVKENKQVSGKEAEKK